MQEELITFETAKLAKVKGLDIYTDGYDADGNIIPFRQIASRIEDVKYPAVNQALLQKWLREVHDIHVWLLPAEIDKTYRAYVATGIKLDLVSSENTPSFFKYEDALEEGLSIALKLIKK